jgi:membrane protease YdiL (CAAX protease family)
MTAISTPADRARPASLFAWGGAVLVTIALAAVVGARWAATRAGLDPVVAGAGFGAGLLLVAWLARPDLWPVVARRPAVDLGRVARAIAIGSAVGLALVAIAVLGPAVAGAERVPGLGRPAAAFIPWVLVTVVVATAEEAILRGVLFSRLTRAGGTALAIATTTMLFALMHVPFYGWHVVPLDLAVGLCLGGLRVATRSVAAPAAAHVVADLASWWL